MTGTTPTGTRKRRLRDRLPVRLRHHWKPAATLGVGLVTMVAFLGDVRISPYVTSTSRVEADAITDNVTGTVGLYDTSASHTIQLTYQQTDFEKMMKEFEEDGTKDYIKADLVVDGVYLNDVGIRLKGNSTLMSLRGDQGKQGRQGEQGERGEQGPQGGAEAGPPGEAAGQEGQEDQAEQGGQGGGRGGGMVQYDLSAEKPEELPWLVKIDEYVEGRAYQGEREISLRPGSNGQVPLNEALSLSLTDTSGQQAERYAFTSVEVNDRPAATRLMVENPDTDYGDEAGDGNAVLYKARAGSSFAYQGDDPSKYESSFKQLNKKGSQDLEPVMKLIEWVENASDEEFARDLDQYVDVESLAAYVATQNLLLNFDDMAGPGKNYLLRYDLDTKKFTVLGWDYNLTFSGDATAGPDDSTGMGGGMPGGGEGGDGQQPSGAPEGMPEGMPEGLPEGAEMPQGGPGAAGGEGQERGGPGGGAAEHPLKTRFLESDAFDEVYLAAYKKLYQEFYASGTAAKEVKTIAEQARAAGAGSEELDTAVSQLTGTVTDRAAALAKDEQVTG
ncbi:MULTISPECIES: CotH kinase family protein [Streptomyces]|uniref:Spore coat protein CotH n=1 Tax=Streptomyces albidoflavus TaxID=1886 RepID=A0AA37FGI2_9ACTN|nr:MULTISPECIES: CotH kinase family protein [Streptomyces]MYX82589.1 spore coat protein CotH [Streptomyces sp. SID4915]QLA59247.1 CotH kinase family protein [Streptomyces violascens]AWL31929.1 spore coat protein CotH [Streptomyces sp. SM17]RZE16172.1 spore coat protein CotH [Streptomyces albidoflavus]RZE34966.1 spore coat protein CotH [Streptomyces albidoflavus]